MQLQLPCTEEERKAMTFEELKSYVVRLEKLLVSARGTANRRGKALRELWPPEPLRTVLRMRIELAQKKHGDFPSSHDILGVVTEEYEELKADVHDNKDLTEELVDLAVAVLRAVMQLNKGPSQVLEAIGVRCDLKRQALDYETAKWHGFGDVEPTYVLQETVALNELEEILEEARNE